MKHQVHLQLLAVLAGIVGATLNEDIDRLTENFFANLQENLIGTEKTEIPYEFIDRQVGNYLELIKETHGTRNIPGRSKRATTSDYSIFRDNYDLFTLEGLTAMHGIDVKNPRDIMLFKHCVNGSEQWYSVSIEHENEDRLILHKYNGNDFVRIANSSLINGIRLGVHTTKNGTYIAVAENSALGEDYKEKPSVYLFTLEEELFVLQKFDVDFASDVSIWENKGEVFMAVAKQMSNSTGKLEYETESPIYKWTDGHFDIVQFISTSEPMKISPFFIGKFHFIVVTNRQNDLGISNVYSEILRYDLEAEKFVTYQKILTSGASDIKVFCFSKDHRKEYFLVVANTYSIDSKDNKIYNTTSIIYKFVDGYFIPFQNFELVGVTEWLPVIGDRGEFALFAACKFEGLKIFSYDGWKFVEAQAQYTDGAFGKGIITMNSYVLDKQPIIVVANSNDNGQMTNFYQLNFKKYETFNKFYDDMLSWCKQSVLDLKRTETEDASNEILQNNATINEEVTTVNEDTSTVYLNSDEVTQIIDANVEQQSTTTSTERVEQLRKKRTPEEEDLEVLQEHLDSQKANIDEIETVIASLRNPSKTTGFQQEIFAENVFVNEDARFDSVIAQTINNVDAANFLRNVININHEINIIDLELTSAELNNASFQFINGEKASDLLHAEDLELRRVEVMGSVIFEADFNINGTVNGLNITDDRVLLKDGDQVLVGELNIRDVNADNVDARFLNKLPLFNRPRGKTVRVTSVGNLKAKNVVVAGFVNNVDIPTLQKYALKKTGDQTINATYIFDELHVDNLITNDLNGVLIPDEFVRIDAGIYKIEQDVQLFGDLITKNLTVTGQLNEIAAIDCKLDVLLSNAVGVQKITGHKSFENINLLRPLKLQGKVMGKPMELMNPVTVIDEEVTLIGDYVIEGNVTIENVATADDVITASGEYSLVKLAEEGLRVLEDKIHVHLNFDQQLNVHGIFADKINDIDPHSWIVNGANDSQYIKGWKIFEGDLHITGRTNLVTVNGINMQEMEDDIMKIDGNQIVQGKVHMQNVNANSIQGMNIKLGDHSWRDIATDDGELFFDGITTFESLKAAHIDCDVIDIFGSINDTDFDKMIEDTVFLNSTRKIGGVKRFQNLIIDDLTSKRSVNLRKIPSMIQKAEVTFTTRGVFEIPENASVERLWFQDEINGLNAVEFVSNWLGEGSEQSISGDQYFENLTLLGENFVASGYLNDINLAELSQETVKIDEEHEFGNVEFRSEIISMDSVTLDGHIEGLDIDNIVASAAEPLAIPSKVNFMGDVFVAGKVYTRGLINDVNFTSLCDYAEPKTDEGPKNLIINGSALFIKGPALLRLNNRSLAEALDNSWLSNRGQTLRGNLRFNQVNFEDDINVKGYVDEINLEVLKNTYFSKSKNQTVTARLEFLDGVKFGADVFSPSAKVGSIMGIRPETFATNVILDGVDQIFENVLFIENFKTQDLQGSFLVNGMNLLTDVMRYDTPNIVTGKKTISGVKTDLLRMDRNHKVQDVDLLSWIQNAVLKSGAVNIEGRTSFSNYTIFNSGISLEGLLNKNRFTADNVLLKSYPQNIVAKKTFINGQSKKSLFKFLKLKGRLNGVSIAEIVRNKVFKNKDITFDTQVDFAADLTTNDVHFDGLYQGINVTQLLSNLTNHVALNNYYNNYVQLYETAQKVRNSLKIQPYYLNYYRKIQDFNDADNVFAIEGFYESVDLVVLRRQNGSQVINFLQWKPETGVFVLSKDLFEMSFPAFITLFTPIQFDSKAYLYVEFEDDSLSEGNTRTGNIVSLINETSINVIAHIESNGTKRIVPFSMPATEKSCLLFLYHIEEYLHIYCEEVDDLKLHQRLNVLKPLAIDMMMIDDLLYIFALSEETQNAQAGVTIWKLDPDTELFNEHQHIYVVSPKSISCVTHNNIHYLAITSGHVMNTLHSGQVDIKKFDTESQRFIEWQEFRVSAPKQVEFSVLPSNELILYVLCDKPTEPLLIYKYKGISKFVVRTVISSLTPSDSMTRFDGINNHFVITKAGGTFTVIQAVFK